MKLEDDVRDNFLESVEVMLATIDCLLDPAVLASRMLSDCLANKQKILVCGNGGSAADAQHFSSELLNRFILDRPALPAIALTTDSSTLTSIANDFDFHRIFSRQIEALGQAGDILLAISTSGQSPNILAAVRAAHAKNMKVIVLTGKTGGRLKDCLQSTDVLLCVPTESTPRIQEVHGVILHTWCEIIEKQLFFVPMKKDDLIEEKE